MPARPGFKPAGANACGAPQAAPSRESQAMNMNPDLKTLPSALRASMLAAGKEIRDCYRVMEKAPCRFRSSN